MRGQGAIFAALLAGIASPAAYPGAGGQQWHTTPGGTTLIDPAPTVHYRNWA